MNTTPTRWRKSSYSGGNNGECIELANSGVEMRDSKNAEGPRLRVPFAGLVAAVKDGRINR
jgi:hypothetical protein